MAKLAIPAAFAAIMMVTAPVAFAQTMTQPTQPVPSHARNTAFTTQSGELRASQIIGSTVYDVQNRNIGSVKDIVLDQNGTVAAVVLDVGTFLGIGGKYVAVSLNDIKTDNNRLTLDRAKEQLESAPAFQLSSKG